MTLSFSTEIEGKPTRFMEKILKGLHWKTPISQEFANAIHHPKFDTSDFDVLHPKIHTIRADKTNRWKVGNKIHMVINNRTKHRFQFAPILQVKSIQTFEVHYKHDWDKTTALVLIDGIIKGQVEWLDCSLQKSSPTIDEMAKNDGFDSTNDFFEWFSEDFKGKMIHWTDKVA